jgi:hypothetical protein
MDNVCIACHGAKKVRNIGNMVDIDCVYCEGKGYTDEEDILDLENEPLPKQIEEIDDDPLPLPPQPKPEPQLAVKLKKGFLSKNEKGKGKSK